MTEETPPALQPWRAEDGAFRGKDDAGDTIAPGTPESLLEVELPSPYI